uniref:Uncharacterized protein n=1 Tax=Chromera velia CCMP2878 TaxID=1169474 RepID=A0A0G4FRH1_9ALVE|eukprot:Cvel_18290.t1-p1 / transcript=Cvel_18290.t1 / gene=Cvel_18290 / organism=Chromera_velia_CCMP2878 / gene_product=hypothetical protein / transcript_product=hypothetical protein / location=Cvel_scaffold1508:791-1774(+) / protein_length=328 / sequence_SO=supercontig / SO=protein_coding / is_pseudo=false
MSEQSSVAYPTLKAGMQFKGWKDTCNSIRDGNEKLFGASAANIVRWEANQLYKATKNHPDVGDDIQALFDQKEDEDDTEFRDANKMVKWPPYKTALWECLVKKLDVPEKMKRDSLSRTWNQIVENGKSFSDFLSLYRFFKSLMKDTKRTKADNDVAERTRARAVLACLPPSYRRKWADEWDEDDLYNSYFDKLIAACDKRSKNPLLNKFKDDPAYIAPVKPSVRMHPEQHQIKQEANYVGSGGFPPKGRGRGRGRGGRGWGGRGGHSQSSQQHPQQSQQQQKKKCESCRRPGGHDPGWECRGKTHRCSKCNEVGHRDHMYLRKQKHQQ